MPPSPIPHTPATAGVYIPISIHGEGVDDRPGVRSWCEVSDPRATSAAWFQKKWPHLSHELPLDEKIFRPELAEEILAGFKTLVPFYKYFAALCASVERKRE